MDINKILDDLDELFAQEKRDEIEVYLNKNIFDALEENNLEIALMLYNEQIGFYREIGKYDKSIMACNCVLELIDTLELQGTVAYATALLNIANAHRAAGYLKESLEFYNQVLPIYKEHLADDDMYYASLYNNISLLYQEMGDFESAKEQLENALPIVVKNNMQFEVAVTYANLANSCVELGEDDKAKAYALESIKIFEEIGVDDAHYSAALSALGSLYYIDKDYQSAYDTMEKSRKCIEKYLGTDNIQYQRLSENIAVISEKLAGDVEEQTVLEENNADNSEEDLSEIMQVEKMEEVLCNEQASENIQENLDEDNTIENPQEIYVDQEYIDNMENIWDAEGVNGSEETSDIENSYGDTEDNLPEEFLEEMSKDIQEIFQEDLTPQITGIELSRLFYEEYGKPMISEKFKAYESKIAVGLVGKGSECFGFDDLQSQDHDFGPGFVMWVTKSVYNEIGKELQTEYEQLPTSFMGIERKNVFHGKDRVGVKIIEDFYSSLLGYDLFGEFSKNRYKENLTTIKYWLEIEDYSFAAATNGEIFRDDEGIFTKYRNYLKQYYPKAVWYRKIAQACAGFSQNGQYNLPRMRNRGQLVAAELAKAECIKYAMKLNYLLNKVYAPHDKWLFKGMPNNPQMCINGENVITLVEKISNIPTTREYETELSLAIETLAFIFADYMEKINITGEGRNYLDFNTHELIIKSDALLTVMMSKAPLTEALSLLIARDEFIAFDKVENEGGRASCQNNWEVFKIMRMSQYMTWTEDMLLQYLYDFKNNYANGRNLIEEKYARMMSSTSPLQYARFEKQLPVISEEKKSIIEEIVKVQVSWMEEFSKEYPNLATNARYIHTSEDSEFDTSYETYLRGEISTYSDKLLELYGRYIVDYARGQKNAAREIMLNTVHFYGYKDLDSANQKGF